MIQTPNNVLVVTGGTSGIGASLVSQAKTRGYQVLFAGSRAPDQVSPQLMQAGRYFQVDAGYAQSIDEFRELAGAFINSKQDRVFVVAVAGISKPTGEETIARMRNVNIGGTYRLFQKFRDILEDSADSRFVGVGSFFAAENLPVKSEEAYQETKLEIQKYVATEIPACGFDLESFAVIPGAVDTPMTRQEMVLATLFVGALQMVTAEPLLVATMPPVVGSLLQSLEMTPRKVTELSPAELFRALIRPVGSEFAEQVPAPRIERVLKGNKNLANKSGNTRLARLLSRHEVLYDRAIEVLKAADIVMDPAEVARALLDQFDSGEVPVDRLLKVYSRRGPWQQAPIVDLLRRVKI